MTLTFENKLKTDLEKYRQVVKLDQVFNPEIQDPFEKIEGEKLLDELVGFLVAEARIGIGDVLHIFTFMG